MTIWGSKSTTPGSRAKIAPIDSRMGRGCTYPDAPHPTDRHPGLGHELYCGKAVDRLLAEVDDMTTARRRDRLSG